MLTNTENKSRKQKNETQGERSMMLFDLLSFLLPSPYFSPHLAFMTSFNEVKGKKL
jgi:hypothetical protein